MFLKKLQLAGFKSFAKSVTLEFPPTISAIVGPNGSGKSNTVEAIAWVLGEQSIKSLRGKKGEDLIFNGSLSVPKMSKASVFLVFLSTNENKETEEISVSRVVYRDGENEYFINGSKCRLKDIMEFLGRFGLGASRHQIISQGEADRVLTASSKERMDMIEDALSLRVYKIKKEEGERKLEKTEENIRQVESLMNEIQPHLRFLKRQVGKAEEAIALKEKLKFLYVSYFSKMENVFRKEAEKLQVPMLELEKEKEIAQEKKADIKEKIEKFKHGKEKINEISAKVNNLEREIGRCEGMLLRMEPSRDKKEKIIPIDRQTRKYIEFKKVESLKKIIEDEIDKTFSEFDVAVIKIILQGLKERVRLFFNEFTELAEKTEEIHEETENKNNESENKLEELSGSLYALKKEEERLLKDNEEIMELERELYGNEIKLNQIGARLNALNLEEEKIRFQKEELSRDFEEAEAVLKEKIIIEPLSGENEESRLATPAGRQEIEQERKETERLKIRFEESGSVSEELIKEYKEIKERDEFLSKELQDLKKTAGTLKDLIGQLGEKLAEEFKSGITLINGEFQKFFELMFDGGNAELKISKSSETFDDEQQKEESGIEIQVNLPRKKIRSLDMLSGGERALTSIALLFAVSQVNPPPFLVLDETDAALDEANSRKYAKMLENLSERTQLIVVTHNRETMKSAKVLYGVTANTDGVSRLLSVKLGEAEELAASR
ncbi:MAG: AAA family ATPase [bacterium]|nr:AAA family ATPase [bacterium]